MATTMRQIMDFARDARAPVAEKEMTMESVLYHKNFDESDEVIDQYENIFDINTTTSKNVNFAFIGKTRSDFDDTHITNFVTSNDSMFPDMIRAQTSPDTAQPTMSRYTKQSLTPLNVGKPIDLSQNVRLSSQSALNYREQDADIEDTEGYSFAKNVALYGLKKLGKGISKYSYDPLKDIKKDFRDTVDSRETSKRK